MKKKISIFWPIYLLSFFLLISPFVVFGDEDLKVITFVERIPFLEGSLNTQSYINALFRIAIVVASVIVVVRIIIAGASLVLSEVVSTRSDAKSTIINSILGLLIILGAVTILNTINPNLTNLNVIGVGNEVGIESYAPKYNSVPENTEGIETVGSADNNNPAQVKILEDVCKKDGGYFVNEGSKSVCKLITSTGQSCPEEGCINQALSTWIKKEDESTEAIQKATNKCESNRSFSCKANQQQITSDSGAFIGWQIDCHCKK